MYLCIYSFLSILVNNQVQVISILMIFDILINFILVISFENFGKHELKVFFQDVFTFVNGIDNLVIIMNMLFNKTILVL